MNLMCFNFPKLIPLMLLYTNNLMYFFCLLVVHKAPETKPALLDAPFHGPVRLSVSKRSSRPPPERRAEMKGLPGGTCLGSCLPHTGVKGSHFKRWHCKKEHGFGFCFLTEHEDEMEKSPVTAGRRLMTAFLAFFFCFRFVFSRLQEEAIAFEEIFSKYL